MVRALSRSPKLAAFVTQNGPLDRFVCCRKPFLAVPDQHRTTYVLRCIRDDKLSSLKTAQTKR